MPVSTPGSDYTSDKSAAGSPSQMSKNKRYYQPIHTIPGQSQPFVLPEGTRSCPLPSCPGYMRPCNPHWRLNEHMKLRHGWPRKNTQPHTDRRLSGKQRSTAYRRSTRAPMRDGKYQSKYVFRDVFDRGEDHSERRPTFDEDVTMLDASPTSVDVHELQPPETEPSSARKSTRKRISTRKALPQNYDFALTVAPDTRLQKTGQSFETQSRRSADTTKSPGREIKGSPSAEGARSTRPSNATKIIPEGTLDLQMIGEMQDYVDELRSSHKIVENVTPTGSREMTTSDSMADDLERLIRENPPRVNACVEKHRIHIPLIKALASRRNSKAHIHGMAPPPNAAKAAIETPSQKAQKPPGPARPGSSKKGATSESNTKQLKGKARS